MSVTDGVDLAAELLEFLDTNWNTGNFSPQPLLHHDDEKLIYPGGDRARNIDLKNNDVVGVSYAGKNQSPVGTEFDYDIEAEVDVRCEATRFPAGGGVEDALDFRRMVNEAQRAINVERVFPLVELDSRYAYRDLRITDSTDEFIEDDNRDYYNLEFTVMLRGYEEF